MPSIILLRFDAPLMSFGGPLVDKYGRTAEFPTLSMLTGLCANALGYNHREADQIQQLQERLIYAVRRDRAGQVVEDYQTVDLSQPFMQAGWTTRGVPMDRGGLSGLGTHVRQREYLADAVFTIALSLREPDRTPTMRELVAALRHPARPLFLGRKPCLPSGPVFLELTEAEALVQVLGSAPLPAGNRADAGALTSWWPPSEGGGGIDVEVVDRRDWRNQLVVGQRLMRRGIIDPHRTD